MSEKKLVDWIHIRSVVDYMPNKYELIYAGFDITERKEGKKKTQSILHRMNTKNFQRCGSMLIILSNLENQFPFLCIVC